MDVNFSEIFETHRGKKCVVIDNFKFREFRLNKSKSKIFWCTNRNCNISTNIFNSLKFFIFISGDHNHNIFQENTIVKQKLCQY